MPDVRHIQVYRDNDAGVWWCTSEDIPGLVSEDASLDNLIERVRAMAPELIELNGGSLKNVHLEFRTEMPVYA